MELKNTIIELIASKREGDYWDFKELYHDNNAELLHDILCMSNSLYKGSRYIIFGVSDPSLGCNIIDLKGQSNRKTQVQLIDFLRNKKFAGDITPEIELRTIVIDKKEVDILIIYDHPHKPYYLIKECSDKGKTVKANHIYTRIRDQNTPITESANTLYIEKMWRQRFGLDLTPLEKMKLLLKEPQEWFKSVGNVDYAYHKLYPEYNIEFSKPERLFESFCYFYTNSKSCYGNAIFKYHTTILFELTYIWCDDMRILLSYPKASCCLESQPQQCFYYYEMSENEGLFLYFLMNGVVNFEPAPFLIFENKEELKRFENYVQISQNELNSMEPDYYAIRAEKEMQNDIVPTKSPVNPHFLSQIKQLYDRWKKLG